MIVLIISEFVKNSFNMHKPFFNLLIIEKSNINIYNSIDEDLIINQTNNLQFQMLELVEIVDSNQRNTYKIKLPNGKNGFITPKTSVLIIPKKNRQVRIANEVNFYNEINSFLDIDKENFDENKHKVVFSGQYAVFNGEIYECLTYIDEIIGFLKPSEIHVMHRTSQSFKLLNDSTIYRDSLMTKPVSTLRSNDKILKSQYVIIEEQKVRFKDNGKIYWLDMNATDLIPNVVDLKHINIDELIIDSMLYQYAHKVENYHTYYQKILSKHTKNNG